MSYLNDLAWDYISSNQKLSEAFIFKYFNKLSWERLLEINEKIPNKVKEKVRKKLDEMYS